MVDTAARRRAFADRPQLADEVAGYVRTRIFEGEFRAGEYLRLDQLAADLGISVTPVREAMLALRGDGLLAQQPRRGFTVLPLTRQDITDVAEVQAFVGGTLAARAAGNLDDAGLEQLRGIQSDFERAQEQQDAARAASLNHEFHRAINLAARSPRLAQLMSSITRYAPEEIFPTVAGMPKCSVDAHREILAALEGRDAEAARSAMSAHFMTTVERLIDHLDETHVLADEGALPTTESGEKA